LRLRLPAARLRSGRAARALGRAAAGAVAGEAGHAGRQRRRVAAVLDGRVGDGPLVQAILLADAKGRL
jgi:hypothetical protein